MRTRKILLIVIGFLALLGLSSLFLKPLLEARLEKYLRDKMVLHNADSPLEFDFKSLDLDLTGRKLNLKGLHIHPAILPGFDSSEDEAQAFQGLEIGRITLHGIDPTLFLWNKQLDIRSLSLDTVKLLLRKTGAPQPDTPERNPGKGVPLFDSIHLPGLTGVRLGVFEMENFHFRLEGTKADTLVRFSGKVLRLNGIQWAQAGSSDKSLFVPVLDSLELELEEHRAELNDGAYALGYDRLHYLHADKSVRIENLKVEPKLQPDEMKARHRYSYETYKVRVADLQIDGLDLDSLFLGGNLRMRSLTIDSLYAEIQRDKSLPFDIHKKVNLPNRALAEMAFPMRIDTLQLRGSYLKYAENVPKTGELIEVEFPDLQAAFYPVVSGSAAGGLSDTLHISLSTNLLHTLPVEVQLQMPYGHDAITLTGRSSGSARLHELNPTVYPAIGMHFKGGRLNGLNFSAHGNSRHMRGHLTMLYHNLHVQFLDHNDQHVKKMESFLANILIRDSNPNRHGRTIVGEIEFQRTPYKGLGNYIWKTVQSGIINSLSPVGKHVRERNKR